MRHSITSIQHLDGSDFRQYQMWIKMIKMSNVYWSKPEAVATEIAGASVSESIKIRK